MSDDRLDGRIALVTGAASGIGRSIARRFLAQGAKVIAFDLSEERLGDLREESGVDLVAVSGDVRSWEDNRRAVATAVEAFGGIDVMVANAGVFDGSLALDQLDPERLLAGAREIFETNVFGYLLGARACLEQLQRQRGSMIFTVSNSAFHAGSGGGVLYASSKHAVVGVVRQLAHELAPEIRVNGVSPGGTITDLRVAEAFDGLVGDRRHFADPDTAEEAIRATNPLRIAPEPDDHAAVYVLLASDGARAITGEVISSDGGLAVRGLDFPSREGSH